MQNQTGKHDWETKQRLAQLEIESILEELPNELQKLVRHVPVTLEGVPNLELQATGIAADTLGLFSGPSLAEEGNAEIPAQITLFLSNLWDFAKGDEAIYVEEVRTTFLHELGHFFGFDEEGLAERGLD